MTPKELTLDAGYQPQVRAKRGTREIMLDVIIALLPAVGVGVWQFGFAALLPVCTSIAACVFFEWLYRKLLKKPSSIGDLSAVVTGLLLSLTLPAGCPWWLPVIGALFAIVFVKQLYGGIGKNFPNPALAGRAFLFASYATAMTLFTVPNSLKGVVDGVTMATPLSAMKAGTALPEYYSFLDMFLGKMPGSFGEISTLALLIGGLYLICRKVITWQIPVAFIGTVALVTLIFGGGESYSNVDWMLYNLLSGGLMLGAIFMATDYSTSPVTLPGRLIYGCGCGLLTVIIRRFGGYPEGVSFAILIMNCCAWFIDQLTQPRRFGVTREDVKKQKEAKKAAKKEAKEAAANG
ncbi:MAG: RnfABCDGE type electron transport complex subunit D [Pyramidobacter sp.]|nr:RnfABCDGE type electron transport complex subunit D [Pyramidobacter sp.]